MTMAADPLAIRKADMRREMRAARHRFVAPGAPQIAPPAAFLARLSRRPVIASYLPVGAEADPAALVAAARAAGCALALPHVVDITLPMRFLAWDGAQPLENGPYGVTQPPRHAAHLIPDIILVPLVAFDAQCHRLGQGGGFYDRALADLPGAWRLGVAWSVQQVSGVPVDRRDVPLHGVVTERDYFNGASS